ncbi:M12 family metallopeptidase [Christiangramia crocea]|uniref:M12 family metallopeptidase n=1 Tax=Christiangramia crocea TaxID=2904124 RepID=A0A9X2A6X8_9FLAO|nr:M12 family metallopeptidase [Gramella crocea]MCG9970982.1 M12 family metallopeptidase [Gramella crocea]
MKRLILLFTILLFSCSTDELAFVEEIQEAQVVQDVKPEPEAEPEATSEETVEETPEATPETQEPEQYELVEGLTQEEVQGIKDAIDAAEWPALWHKKENGQTIIPYYFRAEKSYDFDAEQQESIREAFAEFSAQTNIEFREYPNEDALQEFSYQGVSVFPAFMYGSTHRGMKGGIQNFKVPKEAEKKVILGMAAILAGLENEDQRPDAYDYITIHWENIYESAFPVFEPVEGYISSGMFDFYSITRSHPKAFSKNGEYTVTLQNGVPLTPRNELSIIDILRINYLYAD